MAILKCKMCGGDIIATEGHTFGICDSCGSTVTLPNVNDHRMENLFNRANHFRMISEFDKAVATYEMILNEDNSNAESNASGGSLLAMTNLILSLLNLFCLP